jgi:hypothetical protein
MVAAHSRLDDALTLVLVAAAGQREETVAGVRAEPGARRRQRRAGRWAAKPARDRLANHLPKFLFIH